MKYLKISLNNKLLLDFFTVLTSCIFMLFINLYNNKPLLNKLNFDFGLSSLMEQIEYLIILLLLLFFCYLYIHFWTQIQNQLRILLLLGGNNSYIIPKTILIRGGMYCISSAIGLISGGLFYKALVQTLDQDIYSYTLQKPIILLAITFIIANVVTYLFFKVKYVGIRSIKMSVVDNFFVVYILGVIILLGTGFWLTICLKKHNILITSNVWSLPVISELVCIYLLAKCFVAGNLNKKEIKFNKILFIEYLRREKGIFTVVFSSVMSASFLCIFIVTIVLNSSTYISKSALEYDKPFDIVFDINSLEKKEIDPYLKQLESDGAIVYNINYMDGYIRWTDDEYDFPILILKEDDYYKLTNQNLNLKEGQAALLSQVNKGSVMIMTEMNGAEWSFLPLGEIQFKCGSLYQVNLVSEIWNIVFNLSEQDIRTFILNDADYKRVAFDNNKEKSKILINKNTCRDSLINKMIDNITMENLLIKETGMNFQKAQRKVLIVFTFLVDFVLLICLITFQILRILAEKEKWDRNVELLNLISIEEKRIKFETRKRMIFQTLVPSIFGGVLGIVFSQIYVRQFAMAIFIEQIIVFILLFTVEYIIYKSGVLYFGKTL